MDLDIHHLPLELRPDASRVVVRPFNLAWHPEQGKMSRAERLIEQVRALDGEAVTRELTKVYRDFGERHWQPREIFLDRYEEIEKRAGLNTADTDRATKELLGAYFCHEYSFASAALMNPSVTLHPDQSGLDPESKRVVIALRAVGEGHISSIAFRVGIVGPGRRLQLMAEPAVSTAATLCEADADSETVCVEPHRESNLNETVIFPVTEFQRNGLEDLRITRLVTDAGGYEWCGTYTAYSGHSIRSEMMVTRDFRRFELMPLSGSASQNKGMALFPRKFGNRYAMIGRQDGKNLFLLYSESRLRWERGEQLLEPRFPWEFVQIGNCGPPVELDEGWLLLTHGVGAMRKYAIGAILLDKNDPSKVIGRTPRPILAANEDQRDGYVPNVVYSCGAMRSGDDLFLPYGVADSSVAFAFISLKSIVDSLV